MTKSFTQADIKNIEKITETALFRKNVDLDYFITSLCDDLLQTKNICNILIANKLIQYQKITTDSKMLLQLEEDFSKLKKYLYEFKKKNPNINFSIFGRQKSFFDFFKKIVLFVSQDEPLSKINDILGFRIICATNENDDSIETIELCYSTMENIINFFVTEKHYMPVDAEPIIDSTFDSKMYPSIIVPTYSQTQKWFSNVYKNNIKDYILHPKVNGYQSLHCILSSPEGHKIEIQVRSFAMHKHAEIGKALHSGHKGNRYSGINFLDDIDLTKINISGFTALDIGDGAVNVLDLIGLTNSINPFNSI